MSDSADEDSVLFTYVAPFLGVLLVAVGIGGAVPGGYAMVQDQIGGCGEPTIAVEGPEETRDRFADRQPQVARFQFEELSMAEQTAFREGLADARGEAHVEGSFPNGPAFRNGSLVTYEGERHYVTVVSENPCFQAASLQFPLGLFAIGLGLIGILTPPMYRKLVELERYASSDQ
jgi:hypothetical protein